MQRLNLQVLWVQPPPFENAKVCGIGWRPDERILAIGKMLFKLIVNFSFCFNFKFCFKTLGYNSGKVLLVDVENHQVLHTLELKSEIVSINWTQNTKESYDDFDDLQGNTKLVCTIYFFHLWKLYGNDSLLFSSVCQRTQGFSCIISEFQFSHFKHT